MRICLVTTGHVSTCPRIVKEADALTAAGHSVRVVALRRDPRQLEADEGLMRTRGWRLDHVDAGADSPSGRIRWLVCSAAERLSRLALAAGVRSALLEDQAAARYLVPFIREIVRQPADLVVGRSLAGLPIVARSAPRLGARAAFDSEDLHSGELPFGAEHDAERRFRERIESRYLPRFDLLTAASAGIADEIARRYGVQPPRVILNVFPRREREIAAAEQDTGALPSLYWFSLTIGPDRGLDDALQALALMKRPASLHLRGSIAPAYRETLQRRAAALGVADRLHLLPLAPPEQLVRLAMQHDIGLALEQPASLNRMICSTNKIFLYLLAGLAVAATDTHGQRPVIEAAPGAGFLYPHGDVRALAAGLDRLLESPAALAAAKASAWRAADERFCWDLESLALVEHLTGRRTAFREHVGA